MGLAGIEVLEVAAIEVVGLADGLVRVVALLPEQLREDHDPAEPFRIEDRIARVGEPDLEPHEVAGLDHAGAHERLAVEGGVSARCVGQVRRQVVAAAGAQMRRDRSEVLDVEIDPAGEREVEEVAPPAAGLVLEGRRLDCDRERRRVSAPGEFVGDRDDVVGARAIRHPCAQRAAAEAKIAFGARGAVVAGELPRLHRLAPQGIVDDPSIGMDQVLVDGRRRRGAGGRQGPAR